MIEPKNILVHHLDKFLDFEQADRAIRAFHHVVKNTPGFSDLVMQYDKRGGIVEFLAIVNGTVLWFKPFEPTVENIQSFVHWLPTLIGPYLNEMKVAA